MKTIEGFVESFSFDQQKFKNKKITVFFDDYWYAQIENQTELNLIIKNKKFHTTSNLLNYFIKNKIILNKIFTQQILQLGNDKLIKIKFNSDMMVSGRDEDFSYSTNAIKIIFDNQKSYFYVIETDYSYSFAFGNFCKIQKNRDQSAIWAYIFELDKLGYTCLNDIYDECDEPDEEQKISEKNRVAIKFLDFIKNNLEELKDDFFESQNDKELILQSILYIYVKQRDFFNKHIEIDADSFDYIQATLKTSQAITLYEKEKIKNNLPSHIISSNQKTSSFKI